MDLQVLSRLLIIAVLSAGIAGASGCSRDARSAGRPTTSARHLVPSGQAAHATTTMVARPPASATAQPNDSQLSPTTTQPTQPSTPTTTAPLVAVPDLIDKSPVEARDLLGAVGLALGSVVTSAPNPDRFCTGPNSTWHIPSGSIWAQAVRGSVEGGHAPPGSVVDVSICP